MYPTVSIITPVYNPPLELLEACERSVLNQSFPDFEWILVDDGSSSAIADVLDEFSTTDSRVRVIHSENRGVSSARNVGLSVACGSYVTFIDADDRVFPEFLERALGIARQMRADIVAGRVRYVTLIRENGHQHTVHATDSQGELAIVKELPFSGRDEVVLFAGDALGSLRRYMLSKAPLDDATTGLGSFAPYTIYPKLYRSDLIEGISFDTRMVVGEDSFFGTLAVEKATRVALVDEAWYDYIENASSVTHCKDIDTLISQLESLELFASAVESRGWNRSDVGMRYYQSYLNAIREVAHGGSFIQTWRAIRTLGKTRQARMMGWIDLSQYRLSWKRTMVLQAVRCHLYLVAAALVMLRESQEGR